MAQPDANRGLGATGSGESPPSAMPPSRMTPSGMSAGDAQADVPSGEDLRTNSVFLGFAPWIIFDVVASPSTWKYAALAALIAALVFNVPDLRRGSFKILEAASLVFFAVIFVLGLAVDRQDLMWLETYAQTLANGVIAVVALGSLAFTPFTEQYARESVPRQYWDTPLFRRTNRILTAMWGGVFLVTALLGLLALRVKSGSDWLNWVIPIALLVAAIRFTKWYPAHVRAQARG
ncbi:hypothetical protein SO3561_09996 [Streptomyces olivochromogenes]|uniref:Intracellular septation protein A n=2 Tax=Streptomyces olivochromogenes TaxID=1963 RepID=A0A250VW23_STROL|nr:hypothetical protein SO3561_09996 [Streptomyces olivochromogenes]